MMEPTYGICVADTNFWWPNWDWNWNISWVFFDVKCQYGDMIKFSHKEIYFRDYNITKRGYGYDEVYFLMVPKYIWDYVATIQITKERIMQAQFLVSLKVKDIVFVVTGEFSFIAQINGEIKKKFGIDYIVCDLVIG